MKPCITQIEFTLDADKRHENFPGFFVFDEPAVDDLKAVATALLCLNEYY